MCIPASGLQLICITLYYAFLVAFHIQLGYNMGVSINGGYPLIIHFNKVFPYKPSILGYPFFRKPMYGCYACYYYMLLPISKLNGTPKEPHTKTSVPLSMRSRMMALGLSVENAYDSNLKNTYPLVNQDSYRKLAIYS